MPPWWEKQTKDGHNTKSLFGNGLFNWNWIVFAKSPIDKAKK